VGAIGAGGSASGRGEERTGGTKAKIKAFKMKMEWIEAGQVMATSMSDALTQLRAE
jgi:hypothetical protein